MPYLLTSNPPGSPNSWVKMETDSVLSGNSDYSAMNHTSRPNTIGQNGQHGMGRSRAPPTLTLPSMKYSTNNGGHTYHNNTISSSHNLMSNGGPGLVVGSSHFNNMSSTQMGGTVADTPTVISPTSVLSSYSLQRHLNSMSHLNNRNAGAVRYGYQKFKNQI